MWMWIDSNDETLHQKPNQNTFLDPKYAKTKVQFQKLPGERLRTPRLKGRERVGEGVGGRGAEVGGLGGLGGGRAGNRDRGGAFRLIARPTLTTAYLEVGSLYSLVRCDTRSISLCIIPCVNAEPCVHLWHLNAIFLCDNYTVCFINACPKINPITRVLWHLKTRVSGFEKDG